MQLFDATALSDGALDQILSFLRQGGVIAFPTDTSYGLGADPFNEGAVRRIFEMKGRPESKPILLLVESLAMAGRLAVLSKTALSLAERFWPGPLTMILPSQPGVPDILTAGTGTVGIRWPQADFAMRLIHAWKQPITATSANRSGRGSCVTVSEVREQLGDSVDLIIDGGELPTRGGSTLLDLTGPRARVLREGPILEVELRGVLK